MIVQCESCRSRFKIGDDKITDRGVRVRCTKCGSVFVVRRGAPAPEAAPAPSAAVPLPAASPAPKPAAAARSQTINLFEEALLGGLPPAAPTGFSGSAAAPSEPPGPLDDLLGLATAAPPPSDPRQAAAVKPALDDLFGQLDLGNDPLFAAQPESSAGVAQPPPVDDLFGALPAPPPANAAPALSQAKPAPPLDAGAGGLDLELGPLGGGSATPPPPPTSMPPLDGGSPGASFDDPLAGLDLDPGGGGASTPMPADEPLGGDPFQSASGLELGGDGALGRGPAPAPAEPPRPPEPPAARPSVAPRAAAPPQAPAAPAAPAAARAPDEERSLFTVVFNSVAFGSLIVVLLLSFVVWRSGGKVDFHEPGKALFSAFGLASPGDGARQLPARVDRSGLYPTLGGGQLLFVAGEAKNPAASAQPIEVDVEIVGPGGEIVGSGRGWAGRPPSPEELFTCAGAGGVVKLQEALRPSAPNVPPGRAERFVVALDRPNVDPTGLEIRAVAKPARPLPSPPSPGLTARAPTGD